MCRIFITCVFLFILLTICIRPDNEMKEIAKIREFPIYKCTLSNNHKVSLDIQKYCMKAGFIPSSLAWINGDHWISNKQSISTPLFKEELMKAITKLSKKIKISNISLIDPKGLEDFWVNFYTKGHKQGPHQHVTDEITPLYSFTYFVKYNEKQDAPLRFYTDMKTHLPAKERTSFTLNVKEGDIVFFHPLLEHSVDEQKSSEPRVTVSGNIYKT